MPRTLSVNPSIHLDTRTDKLVCRMDRDDDLDSRSIEPSQNEIHNCALLSYAQMLGVVWLSFPFVVTLLTKLFTLKSETRDRIVCTPICIALT